MIKKMMLCLIETIILSGYGKGEDIFIPKIPLITSDITIHLKRMLFPVKRCSVVSMTKYQGRNLSDVGTLKNNSVPIGNIMLHFEKLKAKII